ncbi:MAG: hypothetical protein LUF85_15155 [Bacteroides sp.]|nr:hypothetical protein [Bacteroides sp.]
MKSSGLFLMILSCLWWLQSCDSTYSYSDYDEKTLTLCFNDWIKYVELSTGEESRQTLRFYLDGTGEEELNYKEARGLVSDITSFQWRWLTGTADTLYLSYRNKQIFYFRDVSIRYNVMYGVWEEHEVCFHAVVK